MDVFEDEDRRLLARDRLEELPGRMEERLAVRRPGPGLGMGLATAYLSLIVLLPLAAAAGLEGMPPDRMPDAIIDDLAAETSVRLIELGDPGTIHDASVARADLPAYQGPSEPPAAHSHEWGAGLADEPEDSPLEGPALAPYAQAGEAEPDPTG